MVFYSDTRLMLGLCFNQQPNAQVTHILVHNKLAFNNTCLLCFKNTAITELCAKYYTLKMVILNLNLNHKQ